MTSILHFYHKAFLRMDEIANNFNNEFDDLLTAYEDWCEKKGPGDLYEWMIS